MKYRADRIEVTMWKGNEERKLTRNSFCEFELTQPRNGKFHDKYWKLMAFMAFHAPEWYEFERDDDVHDYIKRVLGKHIYRPDGTYSHNKEISIKFHKMDNNEFQEHYNKTLRICSEILYNSPETVINELKEYYGKYE
jgi:hypothetical protein